MMGTKKMSQETLSPPNHVPETRKRLEEEDNKKELVFLFSSPPSLATLSSSY